MPTRQRRTSTPIRKSDSTTAATHNDRKTKRTSCCETMKWKTTQFIDRITGQDVIKKQARKDQKKRAKQEKKAQEEANAFFVANGLHYTRPFIRGQEKSSSGLSLQIDRPIAAGPIPILYQTERLIVVSKPAPIPSEKNNDYTRAHMRSVLKHQLDIHGRLSALHRLDICTTGVMLWSTTKEGTRCFAEKIRTRQVQKIYLALVRGDFPIEPTICEEDVDHKKSLTTFYKLRNENGDANTSLVLCVPKTGRKHQIRKHLKCLGYPIANDPRYGGNDGQQQNNRVSGQEQYTHPDVIDMFRSALKQFGHMENVKDLDVLKVHVECCNGNVPDGGGPWSKTWLTGIYLHAWMYYGSGGLKNENDQDDWCFRAPRPNWASGLNLDDLPADVRNKLGE